MKSVDRQIKIKYTRLKKNHLNKNRLKNFKKRECE